MSDMALLEVPRVDAAEVLARRAFVRAAAFGKVVERTAALLVFLSRNNGYEGRDPQIVTDDMSCGAVAQMLRVDVDMLGRALVELHRRGLVGPAEDGNLRILDVDGLDRLSEGEPAQA